MSAGFIQRGGVNLAFRDDGDGVPVLLQHGLGGDALQVDSVFPPVNGIRRITLECRAHGRSGAGSPAEFSIATFADDAMALAGELGLTRFIVGGISMGAAIAQRIAVRRQEMVSALVLVRPAWVSEPAPPNMAPFDDVGRLLAAMPRETARQTFLAGAVAQRLAAEAPDNLASLLRFFDRNDASVTAALLTAIARDGPGTSTEDLAGIAVPTLVIGNAVDLVHPLASARALAALIPNARMIEVAPKALDLERHQMECRTALLDFIRSIEATP